MPARKITIGVSLKMYFGHAQTLEWMRSIADIARGHPAVRNGSLRLFALPAFPALPESRQLLAGSGVSLGAQDLFWEDSGAFTGEVGGPVLAELGCRYVEVGHAERRRIFSEDEAVVAAKTAAVLRNGLTPVLCVGERSRSTAAEAVAACREETRSALAQAAGDDGPVVIAYEPQWAIGASEPAEPEYIRAVCRGLKNAMAATEGRTDSAVIYGGSAGPGLLPQLGADTDGLFLGRFAHDPAAFASVLDEAAAVLEKSAAS
ncbi:MAG TPA: triose-phosphate isomerase family protein [Micrococcaceae bacterium]|nr:triose-phosphate isomerase family protein [Micrococcaceae bacterium]